MLHFAHMLSLIRMLESWNVFRAETNGSCLHRLLLLHLDHPLLDVILVHALIIVVEAALT